MQKKTAQTLAAVAVGIASALGITVAFDEKVFDGCADEPVQPPPIPAAGSLSDDSDGGV